MDEESISERSHEEIKNDINQLISELMSIRENESFITTGWVICARANSINSNHTSVHTIRNTGQDIITSMGLVRFINQVADLWIEQGETS